MKTLYALIALMILSTLPMLAHADEFGDRFWNQSGLALMDPNEKDTINQQDQILANDMDAMAEMLQDIAPAAGDEETDIIAEETYMEENTDIDLGP